MFYCEISFIKGGQLLSMANTTEYCGRCVFSRKGVSLILS